MTAPSAPPVATSPTRAPPVDLLAASLRHMMTSVLTALPLDARGSPEDHAVHRSAAVALLGGLHPTDPLQHVLAASMAGAHFAAMECLRRAALPDQEESMAQRIMRMARTMSQMSFAALGQLRQARGPAPEQRRVCANKGRSAEAAGRPRDPVSAAMANGAAAMMRAAGSPRDAAEPDIAAGAVAGALFCPQDPMPSEAATVAMHDGGAGHPVRGQYPVSSEGPGAKVPSAQSLGAAADVLPRPQDPMSSETASQPAEAIHRHHPKPRDTGGAGRGTGASVRTPAIQAHADPGERQLGEQSGPLPEARPPERTASSWIDPVASDPDLGRAPPNPFAFNRPAWLAAVRSMPPGQLVALADRIQALRSADSP